MLCGRPKGRPGPKGVALAPPGSGSHFLRPAVAIPSCLNAAGMYIDAYTVSAARTIDRPVELVFSMGSNSRLRNGKCKTCNGCWLLTVGCWVFMVGWL